MTTSPTSPSPPPLPDPHAVLSVPAVFSNQVHFGYTNGMFRLTFAEQIVTNPFLPQAAETTVPRIAVMLTQHSAEELVRVLGGFIAQVAEASAAQGALQ